MSAPENQGGDRRVRVESPRIENKAPRLSLDQAGPAQAAHTPPVGALVFLLQHFVPNGREKQIRHRGTEAQRKQFLNH